MKRKSLYFSLVCFLLACFACNEPFVEPSTEDEYIIIPTQELPMGTGDIVTYRKEKRCPMQFRTLEFNTGYIFASAEEYMEAMAADDLFVDSVVCETVDFSQHSVLAVTGLASSIIEKISHRLVDDNGQIRLDIHVQVADTARAVNKWNLLLKTPKLPTQQIKCNITTNQPFSKELPTHVHYNKKWHKVKTEGYGTYTFLHFVEKLNAYEIHFSPSDEKLVFDAINADPECLIYCSSSYISSEQVSWTGREKRAGYVEYQMWHPSVRLDSLTVGVDNTSLMVTNCNFDRTFGYIKHIFHDVKPVYEVLDCWADFGPTMRFAVFEYTFHPRLSDERSYNLDLFGPFSRAVNIMIERLPNNYIYFATRHATLHNMDIMSIVDAAYTEQLEQSEYGVSSEYGRYGSGDELGYKWHYDYPDPSFANWNENKNNN